MDRESQIADLRVAQGLVFDAGQHITHMRHRMEAGDLCPSLARASCAQELNRAQELIRRLYDD